VCVYEVGVSDRVLRWEIIDGFWIGCLMLCKVGSWDWYWERCDLGLDVALDDSRMYIVCL